MDLALSNLEWLICHKSKPNFGQPFLKIFSAEDTERFLHKGLVLSNVQLTV